MKHLLFAIAVMSATLFFACSKDSTSTLDTLLDDTTVTDRGPGGGSGRCMRGDTVDATALPQAALDYLTATYPDLTIAVVVQRTNGFGVELSDGTTVRFNADGTRHRLCGDHAAMDSTHVGGHHPHDSTHTHPHDSTGVHPPHDSTGVHPPHDTTGGPGGGHGGPGGGHGHGHGHGH